MQLIVTRNKNRKHFSQTKNTLNLVILLKQHFIKWNKGQSCLLICCLMRNSCDGWCSSLGVGEQHGRMLKQQRFVSCYYCGIQLKWGLSIGIRGRSGLLEENVERGLFSSSTRQGHKGDLQMRGSSEHPAESFLITKTKLQ